MFEGRTGAEAVCDRRDQTLPFLLLGREIRGPRRRQIDGHEHRLLGKAPRLDPVKHPAVVVRRACLQASLDRVEHAALAVPAYQLIVGTAGTGHPRESIVRSGALEELPECAAHRLGFAHAVAKTIAESPVL